MYLLTDDYFEESNGMPAYSLPKATQLKMVLNAQQQMNDDNGVDIASEP
jgi:hypothetical protein